MSAGSLIRILDALDSAGLPTWLDGGWGVDALLGRQTRAHADADLVVNITDVPRLTALLREMGFVIRRGEPPHSFVLRDDADLEIDIHAVTFDATGNGVHRMENGEDWVLPAEGFTGRGLVGGKSVRCLSPATQVLCHAQGYAPTGKDRRDMALLHDSFGVELPPPLRSRPRRAGG